MNTNNQNDPDFHQDDNFLDYKTPLQMTANANNSNDSDFHQNDKVISFLISLVRVYQRCISPLFFPCCRFQPTCSQYMVEALQKHGIKGLWKGFLRLCKCHPFHPGGYDPV